MASPGSLTLKRRSTPKLLYDYVIYIYIYTFPSHVRLLVHLIHMYISRDRVTN
jgi:hypothetical protein